MAISDSAGNPLVVASGDTGEMLGFVEPAAAAEVLALRIYDFLIKPIRTADVSDGNLFVERYLQGPQEVWETIQTDIFRLLDLWDVTRIPDDFLKFLKNIVGWTPDLERPITDRLTADQLRRLISVSVVLWKIRGTEDAYVRSILALVLTRLRVWNWFDLRWILDETIMEEDHQGRDPYLLGTVDEQFSDIRIVDGALALDRTLLLNMLKLFRPSGERLTVYWIDFLDLFLVDGDDTQWASEIVSPILVLNRVMALVNISIDEEANVVVDDSLEWKDYVCYWRIRGLEIASGDEWGVQFYWQDKDNHYSLQFNATDNNMVLVKQVAAADSTLVTYSFATDLETLLIRTYYGVRVHVETVPTGTRIRVYIDNLERIDHIDTTSPFTRGSVGIFHLAGATIDLNEIELYQLPLASNSIDINETL